VLPAIQSQFLKRSALNPDFIFLEDQVELAQETRQITNLPLNEKARIALRDSQEQKALNIENKRRKARGEELLTALEHEEEDADDLDQQAAVDADGDDADTEKEGEKEDDDVLLIEAGRVLVDVLALQQQSYAVQALAH
jgi:carboxyl-terminal processing protease